MEGLFLSAASHLGLFNGYAFLRTLSKPQVAILMYHRVGIHKDFSVVPVVSPQDFEDQLGCLCREFELMPLDKLAHCIQSKKGLPKRAVVLTFDDGYKDNHTYAYPILKKYNVPVTIFLATGHIGTDNPFWWDQVAYVVNQLTPPILGLDELGAYVLRSDGRLKTIPEILERLKKLENERRELLIERLMTGVGVQLPTNLGKQLILSWDNVREMSDGGIAFGAHSVTHPVLTKLTPAQAEYQILQSKKDIEEKVNRAVTAFCYPFGRSGDFDGDIKRIVRKSGVTCAVTAMPGMIAPAMDVYDLPRIDASCDSNRFKACLSGLCPDLISVLRSLLPFKFPICL